MIKKPLHALKEAKAKAKSQSDQIVPTWHAQAPKKDEMLEKMEAILKSHGIRWVDPPERRTDGKVTLNIGRAPFSILQKVALLLGDNFAVSGGATGGCYLTWQSEPKV